MLPGFGSFKGLHRPIFNKGPQTLPSAWIPDLLWGLIWLGIYLWRCPLPAVDTLGPGYAKLLKAWIISSHAWLLLCRRWTGWWTMLMNSCSTRSTILSLLERKSHSCLAFQYLCSLGLIGPLACGDHIYPLSSVHPLVRSFLVSERISAV